MSFGFVPPKKTGILKKDIKIFINTLFIRVFGWPNLLKRVEFSDFKNLIQFEKMDSVLEIGSGNPAAYAIEFSKNVYKYIATDIHDIEYMNNWNIPNSLTAIKCNVYNLEFDDNSFDKIIMSEVMPVLEKPELALKELFRVLKPNGKLFLINGDHFHDIEELYSSRSIITKLIKNFGISRSNLPSSYSNFKKEYMSLHNTNIKFFQNRDEYIKLYSIKSGFSEIKTNYTFGKRAIKFFAFLLFLKVSVTGNALLPKYYIVFLPILKFLNKVDSKKEFCIIHEMVAKK